MVEMMIIKRQEEIKLTGKFKSNNWKIYSETYSLNRFSKNPSLYELYGSSNFSKGTTGLNAEKSETNEFSAKYDFSENLKIESTLYRTRDEG